MRHHKKVCQCHLDVCKSCVIFLLERDECMTQERKSDDNIVRFEQKGTKVKTFRKNFPISEELRRVLLKDVFPDFQEFAINQYFELFQPILMLFVNEHEPPIHKRRLLEENLFWWRIFFDKSMELANCIEEYYLVHYRMYNHNPIINSWLKELNHAKPAFYFVEFKQDDYNYELTDIISREVVHVMVDQTMNTLEKETVVFGTIFPIGANTYFPFTEFYPFDYVTTIAIYNNLKEFFKQHQQLGNNFEITIHALSAMLEIEHIFLEI